ncbi:BRO-N domain-containing protein [Kozakia baliensis]|nr:BRO family protein [Kozakia baliensis]
MGRNNGARTNNAAPRGVTHTYSASTRLQFEGEILREVSADGKCWVSADDVCGVLGIRNHWDSAKRLDDDEWCSLVVATEGGPQTKLFVSESGAYHLTFISRKPIAKRFRRWVTKEVLPSIRRTGAYRVGGESSGAAERRALTEDQWRLFVQLKEEGRYLVTRMPNGRMTVEKSEWENVMGRWDASTAMSMVHMVRLIETQWSRLQQINTASPTLLDQIPLGRIDMTRYIQHAVELGDDIAHAIRRGNSDHGTKEERARH